MVYFSELESEFFLLCSYNSFGRRIQLSLASKVYPKVCVEELWISLSIQFWFSSELSRSVWSWTIAIFDYLAITWWRDNPSNVVCTNLMTLLESVFILSEAHFKANWYFSKTVLSNASCILKHFYANARQGWSGGSS